MQIQFEKAWRNEMFIIWYTVLGITRATLTKQEHLLKNRTPASLHINGYNYTY